MTNLDQILDQILNELDKISQEDWEQKLAPHKWSKKEILGHLVDSARNNLQRFTEINYFESPYQVIDYNQDELVLANQYQNQSLAAIRAMWLSLNRHIAYLMKNQSAETLDKAVLLPGGTETDLRWLMEDYVDHLLHHKAQILA
jgi:uncharacterized damage-inducible protein DinB